MTRSRASVDRMMKGRPRSCSGHRSADRVRLCHQHVASCTSTALSNRWARYRESSRAARRSHPYASATFGTTTSARLSFAIRLARRRNLWASISVFRFFQFHRSDLCDSGAFVEVGPIAGRICADAFWVSWLLVGRQRNVERWRPRCRQDTSPARRVPGSRAILQAGFGRRARSGRHIVATQGRDQLCALAARSERARASARSACTHLRLALRRFRYSFVRRARVLLYNKGDRLLSAGLDPRKPLGPPELCSSVPSRVSEPVRLIHHVPELPPRPEGPAILQYDLVPPFIQIRPIPRRMWSDQHPRHRP
jgi:hypothetical protein